MWKVTTPDGRTAWYLGDEPDHVRDMAAELFPGVEFEVEECELP